MAGNIVFGCLQFFHSKWDDTMKRQISSIDHILFSLVCDLCEKGFLKKIPHFEKPV